MCVNLGVDKEAPGRLRVFSAYQGKPLGHAPN
jgi:hypothetical protein